MTGVNASTEEVMFAPVGRLANRITQKIQNRFLPNLAVAWFWVLTFGAGPEIYSYFLHLKS